MKKLIATLVAGFLVTGAFAQAPAAPSAKTTGDAVAPMGEGTKGDMKATTPKAKHTATKHKKHMDKTAK
ncbi:hypothetical protein [Xylophilus sp. GOD-11R]|uniref:hypothetical protein n=1 Tax=Xylophilus sp. GOD-11R TaxID=3089814 RepID=UPI00298C2CAD|nr:hypothetical protein [Xylophilus sp. GOD-11R]WPB58228.1 hypothetical protein R9X41_06195 [Xylophilus sp. GOD-11R]